MLFSTDKLIKYRGFNIIQRDESSGYKKRFGYYVDFDHNCEGEEYNRRYNELLKLENMPWFSNRYRTLKTIKNDIDRYYNEI